MPDEHATVRQEFERAAKAYADRTRDRFSNVDVLGFSRVREGETVLEVGVGTGNFLSLFQAVAGDLVGIDLTPAMLHEARASFPTMLLAVADGAALPIRSRSVDLVSTAQTLHHIHQPLPVLMEMRRVMSAGGRVLIVDQVATENLEEARMMNELDRLRDPSHAGCRPPSAFRILVGAAGLEIVDEQIHETRELLSHWIRGDEFPADRRARVEEFIARHGGETGMGFRREGEEWAFTRRRIMLLAELR